MPTIKKNYKLLIDFNVFNETFTVTDDKGKTKTFPSSKFKQFTRLMRIFKPFYYTSEELFEKHKIKHKRTK